MAEGRIEIRLRSILQLFNSMDASPFLEQDLDAEAEALVVSWARELPTHEPLVVVLQVEEALPPELPAEIVATAVHNFFAYRGRMKRRELRELLRVGRTALSVAVVFLGACLLVREALSDGAPSSLRSIMLEGLLILGWVAMWRPLEIWLYDWLPILREARIRERLAEATVLVQVGGGGTTPGRDQTARVAM